RMHRNAVRPLSYVFLLPLLVVGTIAVAADGQPHADAKPQAVATPTPPDAGCELAMPVDSATESETVLLAELLTTAPPESDATPAAGSTKCCDPALEPGVNGNPLCFEGHTCCANGQWQCNNPDGSPSCSGGQVCGSTCSVSGASCTTNADCCSGQCKPNHKC